MTEFYLFRAKVLIYFNAFQEGYLEPSRASAIEFFLVKTFNGFQPLAIVAKELHIICSTGF